MSNLERSRFRAVMRQAAIPIFVGGLIGFLIALLIEWGMLNLTINVYGSFYIIVVLLFIIAFLFLGLSLYMFYNGHAIWGGFFLVAGFKLLNWILQWYLPIYWDGEWGTFGWYL